GNSCIPGSDHHAPEAGGDPEYRPAAQKRGLRALGANGGHSEAGGATSPVKPLNRPMSAHSTVKAPWSGQCASYPFCTSWMRTSRDFWAGLVATYKVLTTLPLVECSQVRQLERKEEMKACPGTTGDYSNRTSYLTFGRYMATYRSQPHRSSSANPRSRA